MSSDKVNYYLKALLVILDQIKVPKNIIRLTEIHTQKMLCTQKKYDTNTQTFINQ